MIHIDGPTNPADVGTKRDRTEKAQIILWRITERGRYHPIASADFANTFGALTAIFEIDEIQQQVTWLNGRDARGGYG